MIISSYQESTIDYPGKYGPILFTQGCNFTCGFCHNPELAELRDESVDNQKLLKDIKRKAKRGWYNGITISGGEPTLQKDLPEFVKELKSYGLAIKLDSNGSNPEVLERLLEEGNVDYVAMDMKAPRERYQGIVGDKVNLNKIDRSIELVKKFPMHEFRTTVLPFFSKENLEQMGEWVINGTGKVKLYSVQQFNPEKCFDKKYEKLIPKPKEEIESLGELMKNYSQEVRVLGL